MDIDEDVVQQRLQRCIPELSAELLDRSGVLEADEVTKVLMENGLLLMPMEDFVDDA